MTPEEAHKRKNLYRDVEYTRMTPADADAQLAELGQEPFQRQRPDRSNLDPLSEKEWTLPMAAAWFIWRSPDAVRDQWNPARQGWRKWVRTPKRRMQAGGPHGPYWKLKSFGPATLADVFDQAGLPADPHKRSAPNGNIAASDHIHTPYSRFKEALQSGCLRATWGKREYGDSEEIPAEYWRRKFDAIANPKSSSLSEKPELVPVRSTARSLKSQGVPPALPGWQ
jgi:hypothetical protein